MLMLLGFLIVTIDFLVRRNIGHWDTLVLGGKSFGLYRLLDYGDQPSNIPFLMQFCMFIVIPLCGIFLIFRIKEQKFTESLALHSMVFLILGTGTNLLEYVLFGHVTNWLLIGSRVWTLGDVVLYLGLAGIVGIFILTAWDLLKSYAHSHLR